MVHSTTRRVASVVDWNILHCNTVKEGLQSQRQRGNSWPNFSTRSCESYALMFSRCISHLPSWNNTVKCVMTTRDRMITEKLECHRLTQVIVRWKAQNSPSPHRYSVGYKRSGRRMLSLRRRTPLNSSNASHNHTLPKILRLSMVESKATDEPHFRKTNALIRLVHQGKQNLSTPQLTCIKSKQFPEVPGLSERQNVFTSEWCAQPLESK